MNPEPASALNGYIDRLNILKAHHPLNLMALKSIEREALQLINSDAQTAYLVLGILYAIKNQAKESRDYFKKSLNLSDDLITRANFARSLDDLQYYQEATQEYECLLKRSITPQYLYDAAKVALHAGYPDKTILLSEKLVKLQPETNQDSKLMGITRLARIAKQTGLSDQAISEIHAIAEEVIHEFGVKIGAVNAWLDTFSEAQPMVYFDFYVAPEYSYNMMNRLIDKYVEKDYPVLLDGKYFISFKASA